MVPGKGPTFTSPLDNPEDLDKINLSPDVNKVLQYVYDAITLTRKTIGGKQPLFGFVGAPWTLMAYMVEGGGSKTYSKVILVCWYSIKDILQAKKWLYQYPEASEKLLNALTTVCIDFLVGQARAGAQVLQVFESHADALSPELFHKFTLKLLKRIATEVKSKLGKNILNF
jgi:uroporphyrinogen decarboxylase